MIETKEDLRRYLEADKKGLRKNYRSPRIIHDRIWKFEILLRKCEYIENCKKGYIWNIIGKVYKLRYVLLAQKLGFSIPFNVIDEGLYIAHYGAIVINENSKIGKNCRIHEGTCIGANGKSGAPKIGNNVFIATGAKIIGNIKIADGVAIGANAVVVKDILEPNTTWAGVPARKISNKGSSQYIRKE